MSQWIVSHYKYPNKSIDELLPASIEASALPLGLQQAEEALIAWDTTIKEGLPSLYNALRLNELLNSPAVAKFLGADQQRVEIFDEWFPRITASFEELKASIAIGA